MNQLLSRFSPASLASVSVALGATRAHAQTACGVPANGTVVRFDVTTPGLVTFIRNLAFIPEGIDFRPSPTTLFAIDSARDALVTQNPPNAGQPNTVAGGGLLGVNFRDIAGFDVFSAPGSGMNSAFAGLQLENERGQKLYSIDLTTGAAGLVGLRKNRTA